MATKDVVISVLRKCYDPEIPINIYDLGLVPHIERSAEFPRVAGHLTSKGGKESDALARAFGALVEGLTFYDLANVAVAEMRVKVAFEELGRHKKDQLARLESVAGSGVKDAAVMPGIYPINVVAKVECYVCGFVAETKAIPHK